MSQTSKILAPLHFPLGGARLIEASAGTGKTYTIATLYLRLVLGHGGQEFGHPQGALTPDQILVVTFTKAATAELKDRIRRRLVEGVDAFRAGNSCDGLLKDLLQQYDAAEYPRCARLLELAAQMMDQAAIHTIHAWCQRMLREHAFDSGSLFNLKLETDITPLKEEAVRDYWRTYIYPSDEASVATILTLYPTPSALQNELFKVLGKVTEQGDPFTLVRQQQQQIAQCKRVWQEAWPQLLAQLQQAHDHKKVNRQKIKTNHFEQLYQWFTGPEPLPSETLVKRYQSAGMVDAAAKGQAPLDSSAFEALTTLVQQLEAHSLKETLLCHAGAWVQQRILSEKHRLALMDPDDLIRNLDQALRQDTDKVLSDKIRHQFPVALIDEFQDTDEDQYRIFSGLYLEQPHTGLMMIGDPKQAIYAFRGADIHTYLAARNETSDHYSLETNYRSTQAMVDAVNGLFLFAEQQRTGAFMYQGIPFEPVKARGQSVIWQQQGVPQAALQLCWQATEQGAVTKGDYLMRMSEACAESISQWLTQGPSGTGFLAENGTVSPVGAADIAILVRDGSEANAVRQALDKRGVRSVYLSDQTSVYQSQEAADLQWILQGVAQPRNDRAVRAALATQTLGMALSSIEQLSQNEQAWEQELTVFKGLLGHWQQHGVLPMLRQLLQHYEVAQRCLAEPTQGERRLTNLLHLAELLQAASTRLDGEQALLRYLREQRAETHRDGDEQITRLESDAALVKVITIHKSKGLQYKLVWLPFVLNFRQVNSEPFLYRDPQQKTKLSFKKDKALMALADEERLAEDIRLLYVALTRAEFGCYLGLMALKSGQNGARGEPNVHLNAFGHLLGGGTAFDQPQLEQQLQCLVGYCNSATSPKAACFVELPASTATTVYQAPYAEVALPEATAYQRQPFQPWWISSYSGLLQGMASHAELALPSGAEAESWASDAAADRLAEMMNGADDLELLAPQLPQSGTIHAFPKGAAPGSFLHDLFEWAAMEGQFQINMTELSEHLGNICPSHGYGEYAPMLAAWMAEALQVPLPLYDTEASLLALPLVRPELEFWFEANQVDIAQVDALVCADIWPGHARPALNPIQLNGMLKGFIDLTFYYQGRYYVADYKSNYLGVDQSAYQKNEMIAAMLAHRYDLQAVLYTLALHRQLKSRLPDYDFDTHIGGGLYLFVRGLAAEALGQGALTVTPSKALVEQLDQLFSGHPMEIA
ncbi:MAG: exodeoxyribonuclease V subunit beta [Ferrimonas sp.]